MLKDHLEDKVYKQQLQTTLGNSVDALAKQTGKLLQGFDV